MIRNVFIAGFIVFILGCNSQKTSFSIEGTVTGGEGRKIFINQLTTQKVIKQDSAIIDENDAFELKGDVSIASYMTLQMKDEKPIYLIVHPGDKLTLTTDAGSFELDYLVKGSNDSELVHQLIVRQQETIEKIIDLANVYRKKINNADAEDKSALVAERNEKREALVEAQRKFTTKFIKDHPSSLASLMALYQYIDPATPVLRPEKDFEIFLFVDSALMKKYPSSEAVKSLNRYVVKQSQQKTGIGMGDLAPEIALPDPGGDTIRLSSLKGKYVLLDFWASWCPPCRKENPNLVKAYKQFADKGFEIFQVSLDKTREEWQKGIEADNLKEWYHVSDLKYWNSYPARLYGINQIPSSFLLNPDRKVIAVDLHGQQLTNKLEEIFN